MNPQLWIEPVGELIIARVRGIPSETLLRECQARVLSLVEETGRNRVLYDVLEMDPPPVEVALCQRKIDEESVETPLRRAIVVPNTRLAYLARLAFGEGDYRVSYSDMTAAILWLNETESPAK
jgi:hypothetical protein